MKGNRFFKGWIFFFKGWMFSLVCTTFAIALMYSSALGQFGNLQTPLGLYPQSFSTYSSPSFSSSPYQAPSYGAVSATPFSSLSGGSSLYGSPFALSAQPSGYQSTLSFGYPSGSGLYGGVLSSGGFSSGFTSAGLVSSGLGSSGLVSQGLLSPGVGLTTTPGFSSSFFGTSLSPSISSSSRQVPVAVSLGQSYMSGGFPSSSFGSPAFTVADTFGFQQSSSRSPLLSGVYGSSVYTSSTPFSTSMTLSSPLSGYTASGSMTTGNFPAATTFGLTGSRTASWLPSSSSLSSTPFQFLAGSYSAPFSTVLSTPTPYGSSSTQTPSPAPYSNYTPNLSSLCALWQGTYIFYNKDLEEETKGLINLQLTKGTNQYQVSGYMTVTDWEVVDEKKKGRVLATVTYTADNKEIDFVNILVRFYPELGDNEKPDADSTCYVWMFSGSLQYNMLECSLYVGGPDDYCKTGTIVLARKAEL